MSYGALVGFFLVPAVIVSVAMRSSVVSSTVDAWLDGPCPDCGAGRGVSCHVACSSWWD